MFGDLDLYKDEAFFNENTTGTLVLPDRTYHLQIFACLLVPASEDAIFDVNQWDANLNGLLDFAQENALHLHSDTLDTVRAREGHRCWPCPPVPRSLPMQEPFFWRG